MPSVLLVQHKNVQFREYVQYSRIHMYGVCTKVFKPNTGRITLGITPFGRKRRRGTTPNVKLIPTSFMEGKLYSHGLEVESFQSFLHPYSMVGKLYKIRMCLINASNRLLQKPCLLW